MLIIRQLNRLPFKFCSVYHLQRNLHNTVVAASPETKILYPLQSRSLLKITGDDTSTFLQGLITNDMRHFDTGASSIYAMFLNNKGRVLYDTLIHRWDNSKAFMIECDSKLVNMLMKHLKMFKLRRKIKLEDASKDFKLWVIIAQTSQLKLQVADNSIINIYKDPRLPDLGIRVIALNSLNGSQIAEHFGSDIRIETNENGYKFLRYKLGVSEGADDLPPASSFPLEVNCDYLHGVSFHKGCYIGQEVTARVHHTGIVRKRIMPLKFMEPHPLILPHDTVIVDANKPKSNIGKIKGFTKNYGIGLVRIKEALETKTVKVAEYSAEPYRPTWWPLEAPKEIHKTNEAV